MDEREQGNGDLKNKLVQWLLLSIGGVSILCAVLHAFWPERFDDKTAMFLGIAGIAVVLDKVSKFKGFGIELEKQVDDLKQEMRGLEKNIGPGSKGAVASATTGAAKTNDVADPEDPNKGQFGGEAKAHGRILTATIKPAGGPRSAWCKVRVKVKSMDVNRPLNGKVRFFLHPTFGQWSQYDVDVENGIAEDEFESYGAFTVGAEADNGKTRLELDLMDVKGGSKTFYES